MPYIKYLSFKTGINPSIKSRFDLNCLTGTQKLMLASSRIFGNSYNGNERAGTRVMRSNLRGAKRLSIFEIPIWNHKHWFPFLRDFDREDFKSELVEARRMRVLMRGVKIGRKKGQTGFSMMNIFEKKSDKPNEPKKQGGEVKKLEATTK